MMRRTKKDLSRNHEIEKTRNKARKLFAFYPPEVDVFMIIAPQPDHKMQRIHN